MTVGNFLLTTPYDFLRDILEYRFNFDDVINNPKVSSPEVDPKSIIPVYMYLKRSKE